MAVALVAVALCTAVLGGGYAATARATADDSQRLAAGAPLRAQPGQVDPGVLAAAASVPGVSGVVPVVAADIDLTGVPGSFLALSTDGIARLLFDVPRAASPAHLAAVLDTPSAARPLGAAARQVTLSGTVVTTAPDVARAVAAVAWVVDGSGSAVAVPLGVEASRAETDGARFTARGQLPSSGPWALAAVSLEREPRAGAADLVFTELLLSVDGSALDATLPQTTLLTAAAPGQTATASATVWSAGGDAPPRVPIVVTSAFASAVGVHRGDDVDLPFAGTGRAIRAAVADVVPAIPGIGAGVGVVAPLGAVVEGELPAGVSSGPPPSPTVPNQLWASGPSTAAAALSEALGVPVSTVDTRSTALTAPVIAVWIVAAAGGAALAGVALVALLTAVTRQRAGEVLVLRAMGTDPPRQAAQRIGEAVGVVACSVVLGVAGGAVLGVLLVPGLVRRAVPGAQLAPVLAIDGTPVGVAVAVVAAATALGAVGIAAALRAHGRSTRLEEAAA